MKLTKRSQRFKPRIHRKKKILAYMSCN